MLPFLNGIKMLLKTPHRVGSMDFHRWKSVEIKSAVYVDEDADEELENVEEISASFFSLISLGQILAKRSECMR